MKLMELRSRPTEMEDERQHIEELISDFIAFGRRDKLQQAAEIFANFRYRDDRDGWLTGIPFSTDPQQLNTALRTITAQGDEMATKRLLRRILELTDG